MEIRSNLEQIQKGLESFQGPTMLPKKQAVNVGKTVSHEVLDEMHTLMCKALTNNLSQKDANHFNELVDKFEELAPDPELRSNPNNGWSKQQDWYTDLSTCPSTSAN